MKSIKQLGLIIFLSGLTLFTLISFFGSFSLSQEGFEKVLTPKQINNLQGLASENLLNKEYRFTWQLASDFKMIFEESNQNLKAEESWSKVMYSDPNEISGNLAKEAAFGMVKDWRWLWFFLSFGFGIIGALMYMLPDLKLLGKPGIKNNHIYQRNVTNRGWIAWVTMFYLIGFYLLLYFFPYLLTNQILLVDDVSLALSGNPASRWFLYGFMYTVIMGTMAVRMFIKYRHSPYQMVRTGVVFFFQLGFAFLIPEILVRFNQPYMDFKNAWPLNYNFFFEWNINNLIANGQMGQFMLVWGIVLAAIIVPVFSYFFGKRWYCSWVCGCGGLAETLGDPYRQHSDKSLFAWKFERWSIHLVLVFAVVMTGAGLYAFNSGLDQVLGIGVHNIQKTYGFLIGSIFAGVIGTGFYPIFGNRVWCRFGCPLAAYMGLIQRFKSRFRITTNGGQCISCGNCSTYCEQGIDVRWYAQRGQNIVRSSCVGCGVCSSVCPRGVLKLENGPEEGRINDNPIIIGHKHASLAKPSLD